MSLKLKLKPNPNRTLDLILQIRPPIRLKEFLIKNNNNDYNEFDKIRRQKIIDYATRQKQKTETEKAADYQEIDELQRQEAEWVERKMKAPSRAWERWNK